MNDDTTLWEKRNLTDEFRILDMIELYESMGYEVKVEDYSADNCSVECNSCLVETPEKFKVVYTRRLKNFDDELFEDTF
jgi:hypothetical protein